MFEIYSTIINNQSISIYFRIYFHVFFPFELWNPRYGCTHCFHFGLCPSELDPTATLGGVQWLVLAMEQHSWRSRAEDLVRNEPARVSGYIRMLNHVESCWMILNHVESSSRPCLQLGFLWFYRCSPTGHVTANIIPIPFHTQYICHMIQWRVRQRERERDCFHHVWMLFTHKDRMCFIKLGNTMVQG